MEIDRDGLEVLDRTECLRLLAQQTIGRIAFTTRALPTVLPVNFQLDGERILVRTRRGGRLDDALHDSVVAFEIDQIDADTHAGWNVAVTGHATHISDGDAPDEPNPLAPYWPCPRADSVIAISTELLTGRRQPKT